VNVVVKQFPFAISSPDELLVTHHWQLGYWRKQ